MSVVSLDSRRPTIGGSTIAAAAGIDPWCSRYALWARLRGLLPAPDDEPAWWARRIRPLIFEALRAQGIAAEQTPGVELPDPRRKWLVGHPDGLGADAQGQAVIVAKLTAGSGYRSGDTLPLPWQAQAHTYMRLGHVGRCLVAVYAGGVRLEVVPVDYNEHAATRLVELAADFMNHVRRGTPPAPDGSQSARAAIADVFPHQAPGSKYRLTGVEWEWAKDLRALREQKGVVEEQITELENKIKSRAEHAETIISPHDTTFATWKAVTSHRIDTARLRKDRPDIATEYATETTTRRFLLA